MRKYNFIFRIFVSTMHCGTNKHDYDPDHIFSQQKMSINFSCFDSNNYPKYFRDQIIYLCVY